MRIFAQLLYEDCSTIWFVTSHCNSITFTFFLADNEDKSLMEIE